MSKVRRSLLVLTFIVAIVLFFVLYLRGIDYSAIKKLSLNWTLLALATVLSVMFRYWGVFIWRTILMDLGAKSLPKFNILSSIYSKAWMGRYIPGSITWIAGKIYLASSLGISKSRLTVASLLEAAVQISAVASVSLLLVGLDTRTSTIPSGLKLLLVVGAVAMLISLHPSIFNRIIGFVFKKVRRKEAYSELSINNRAVIRSFIMYAVGSIIAGTSYFFLTSAIEPSTSWSLYLYLVGAYNLAGVIGMATPLVPSGLGVRDSAQLILLSAVFPKEIALALTVFSRLWSAIVDVIFFAMAQMYHKFVKSRI